MLSIRMGVLDKFKTLGGDDEPTYRYQCSDCETSFESSVEHPKDVECVECGSDRIHSAW